MGFDIEAFAGAVWSLSETIDEAARKTGIEREPLSLALHRYAIASKNKREAEMWRHARSKRKLSKWIYEQSRPDFDSTNEKEILKLAKEIPLLVRRGLIEIAKNLPRPRGGKHRSLDTFERFEAKRLVRNLREKNKPLSKEKAYAKVARLLKVSPHTIRRECDPKERERSRKPKGEDMSDLSQLALQ